MKQLELVIAGGMPDEVSPSVLRSVVATISQMQPEWLQSGTIGLDLVDDASIKTLNEKYAGHDYATDVLSFSYLEAGAAEDGELGDMIISVETARRQAAAAKTTLADELGTLTAHGILHIFGFDHATASERDEMDSLQRAIVESAGLKYREFLWTT